MQFENKSLLNVLWVLPVLVGFLYWRILVYRSRINEFVSKDVMPQILSEFMFRNVLIKLFLLVCVFILSVVALARPQWGFEWQDVKKKGIDILILVDTSKSMLTTDVLPNRLERTKFEIKDLLKKLKGDRVGLIAFAGDAFLMCPLTSDYNGFRLALNDLRAGSVPRGGTNLQSAFKVALEGYKDVPSQFKTIILITDGDNLEGNPLKMAEVAKQNGIKVYTVGIGTQEGELIQVRDSEGNISFLKDNAGNFVKSRLNESLLKKIAAETSGAYVRSLGAESGLDVIYAREISKLEKRDVDASKEKKYFERFQIPLTLAFLCLLIETCLSNRKRKLLQV